MNQYATDIAIASGVFIFGVVLSNLLVSWLLYKRLGTHIKYLLVGLIGVFFAIVWLLLGSLLLFFFAFCSSCFGPGSPQEVVYERTFQLPLQGSGFLVSVAALCVTSVVGVLLLTKTRSRLLKILSICLLAFFVAVGVVGAAITTVNSNPDGVNIPLLADARNLKSEPALFVDPRFKTISFTTSESPDAVLVFYERELQKSGWVPLYDDASQTPKVAHAYWRVTSEYRNIYLRINATETDSHMTFVYVQPTDSLNYIQ
jgi:hypothetical protein